MKKSQTSALLKLMLHGKPVDHNKAERLTGCTTIRSRISDFKKLGYKIDKVMVKHNTRYNTSGYHASYTLDLKHAKKNKLI